MLRRLSQEAKASLQTSHASRQGRIQDRRLLLRNTRFHIRDRAAARNGGRRHGGSRSGGGGAVVWRLRFLRGLRRTWRHARGERLPRQAARAVSG